MPPRPLAPHVQAALAAQRIAVQAKPTQRPVGARPLAPHVQAAIQAKPAASRPAPRVAEHVHAAVNPHAKTPVPAAPAPRPAQHGRRPATVQRALKRTGFWSDTKSDISLSKGEHRRHIISNHLMKRALNAWWDAHKGDKEGAKTSVKKLQGLLDEMNNYQPNLKAGAGAPNSAIGMFTNMASQKIESFASTSATPTEMETGLSKMRGFHIATQHELIDPVLSAFTKDPHIGLSSESALPFAVDLMDSTDFDWPEGADPTYFDVWQEAYNSFLSLESHAAHYSFEGMMSVCGGFLKLPDPGP
jgi:hypothetical protein